MTLLLKFILGSILASIDLFYGASAKPMCPFDHNTGPISRDTETIRNLIPFQRNVPKSNITYEAPTRIHNKAYSLIPCG